MRPGRENAFLFLPTLWLSVVIVAGASGAPDAAADRPTSRGPYLGLEPPGTTPVIFAPGIVSTELYNHSSVTLSPDGGELYWAMGPLDQPSRIYVSRRTGDGWSRPEIVPFTKEHDGDCPVLSPDGQTMFFNSTRPSGPGETRRERYWMATRTIGGWSQPEPLGAEVNGGHLHWQASVDRLGNFYFGSARDGSKGRDDVFVATAVDGTLSPPVSMGAAVNTEAHEGCPFVSPDATYLVFARGGLWVSFRRDDGSWTEARSLGEAFDGATCPYVSPDGRYLFFLRMGMGYNDVYWVDSSVIGEP